MKACNFGAIEMENGVPKIDYEKCVGCMACADACPTGAMEADFETRKEAYIDPSKCVGSVSYTHLDVYKRQEEKPDTLIVNGSECEPYLTSDHRIMVENAEQIVDGIVLAMKASGVSCAKVGIEDNKPDAIAAMREAASDKQNVEVVSLPARYPQGDVYKRQA